MTTKPTRYLGRTLVKTKEGYNFGVDASYVKSMLEEVQHVGAQRWERRETDEKETLASEQRVHRQMVG